jgi:Aldolase/RraA
MAPFRARSTSFVVDAMNGRGALDHRIKALDPHSRLVGSALTARAGARDNLAALAALDLIEPGDVLVIAAQGFCGTATLGDNMARIAQLRGAAGIVTDGLARDAAEIVELGIPVFCRGVTPCWTATPSCETRLSMSTRKLGAPQRALARRDRSPRALNPSPSRHVRWVEVKVFAGIRRGICLNWRVVRDSSWRMAKG